MFERGKIRMLGFKERITKIVSKIFGPRKRERWKKIEDTVKIITKVKADGIIKNKVGLYIAKDHWATCSKFRSK